jgi:hypothetical protein
MIEQNDGFLTKAKKPTDIKTVIGTGQEYAALIDIPSSYRYEGMQAIVIDTTALTSALRYKLYRLDGGIGDADWTEVKFEENLPTAVGDGQTYPTLNDIPAELRQQGMRVILIDLGLSVPYREYVLLEGVENSNWELVRNYGLDTTFTDDSLGYVRTFHVTHGVITSVTGTPT